VQIEYSASATGAGEDHLIDTNKDGFYDGYVQNRYSYDVFNSMYQAFISGTVRVLYLTRQIKLDNYPDNPRDVVSQFLKLNMLNSYETKLMGFPKD